MIVNDRSGELCQHKAMMLDIDPSGGMVLEVTTQSHPPVDIVLEVDRS